MTYPSHVYIIMNKYDESIRATAAVVNIPYIIYHARWTRLRGPGRGLKIKLRRVFEFPSSRAACAI